MSDSKEIKALIHLLDDPDDFIYSEIKKKLLSYGEEVIPELESFWESNPLGLNIQDRIEDIIHLIQFDSIKDQLRAWANKPNPALLEGALLINKYQYPELDTEKITKEIEQIKTDIWIELNNNLTSYEKVNVINHVFFNIYGFSGNKKNYHSPQNSFINNVLESKKGNPLSLSIIYLTVTQPLGLPIYGVNLPSHFILCYLDEFMISSHVDSVSIADNILFYINPFSRGTIFNKKEIERFLKQLNLPINEKFYTACTNIDIVKRMLNNLMFSFEKKGYQEKVEELKELYNCL